VLKERVCKSGENSKGLIPPCSEEVRLCTFAGVCYALLGSAGIL